MRLRRVLLPAIALVIGATSLHAPSFAAVVKKPVCNLVSDQPGDGQSHSLGFMQSDALDIRSGDIATGAKYVYFVLRVGTTNLNGDTWSRFNYKWAIQFDFQNITYMVQRSETTDAVSGKVTYKNTFNAGSTSTDLADSAMTITPTSIQWKVPRTSIAGLNKKPNQKLGNFQAGTWVAGGNADSANSGPVAKTYIDKWPSCVKVS